MSCERYQGLESDQIYCWLNENSKLLLELSNKSIQAKVSGEMYVISDFVNLQASFSSKADKESFENTVDNLLNKLNFPDVKLTFSLGLKDSNKAIYISLYQNGFCAAFGDCFGTYLVYYLDDKAVINDQNYHYSLANVDGWYLLKVSNN